MDEQFFDDLAKGLDEGTISRRQALKLVGAAALSAALLPMMPKQAQALSRRFRRMCRRKGGIPLDKGDCHCSSRCGTTTIVINCQNDPNCWCLETVGGKGFCA